MFKKLTFTVVAMFALMSLGCACQSGGFYRGACGPCGPCDASYECSACEPAACTACQPAAPCEAATCSACMPAAPCGQSCSVPEPCQPSACEVSACGACNSCSSCNTCNFQGCRLGIGSDNGLFSSFGSGAKMHGFGKRNAGYDSGEMYVTRGPRDFFDPNPNQVRY